MQKIRYLFVLFFLHLGMTGYISGQAGVLFENFDALSTCSDEFLITPDCLPGWGVACGTPNPVNPGNWTWLLENVNNLSGPAAMVWSQCGNDDPESDTEGLFVDLSQKLIQGGCYQLEFLIDVSFEALYEKGEFIVSIANGLSHSPAAMNTCGPVPTPQEIEEILVVELNELGGGDGFTMLMEVSTIFSPENSDYSQMMFHVQTQLGLATVVFDEVKVTDLSCPPFREFTNPSVTIPPDLHSVTDYILTRNPLPTGELVTNNFSADTEFKAGHEIIFQAGTLIEVAPSNSFYAHIGPCAVVEFPEECDNFGGGYYTVVDPNTGLAVEIYHEQGMEPEPSEVVAPIVYKLYPNPVNGGVLRLSFLEQSAFQGTIDLRLVDVYGKEVMRVADYKNNNNIRLSGLTPGSYLLEIVLSSGERFVEKIIIL